MEPDLAVEYDWRKRRTESDAQLEVAVRSKPEILASLRDTCR